MSGYTLRRPCANCPFRTDVESYIRGERAIEIARSLAEGAEFPCHKTTDWDDGDVDDYIPTGSEEFCAGALILMEHEQQPNQMVRIAESLGVYKAEKLDMTALVFTSFISFIDHHYSDEKSSEPCSVCDAGCEAPAGYLVGGVVIRGEAGETSECPSCYEPVCGSCCNFEGICNNCDGEEL